MTPPVLPDRERAVLQRIALGDTRTQAAAALGVSEATVHRSLRTTVAVLNARCVTHAVTLALTAGLIHPYSCGDVRTYRWHLRHGETSDRACQDAENSYQRTWRARQGTQA